MKYVSTRGGVSGLSFCDAVMMGLASDGGLLVPEAIPDISAQLKKVAQLSYQELAFEVMSNFIDDISPTDLRNLIDLSYSSFDEPDHPAGRSFGLPCHGTLSRAYNGF